jgi:hypothetical protein
MSITCIVVADLFFKQMTGISPDPAQAAFVEEAAGGTEGYRVVHHQSDSMPELAFSKHASSLEEAKAHAEGLWANGRPVYWGLPTKEEKTVAGGIVCVMREAVSGQRPTASPMAATGPRGLEAWIENRNENGNEIASLFVAAEGRIVLDRCLARGDTQDFWYEGCDVRFLAWYDDRLAVVTRERAMYLWIFDPVQGGADGMPLPDSWLIYRDVVLWASQDPGLLAMAALPSLDARPPLPCARQDIALSGDGGPDDKLALPTDRQRAEYAPVPGLLDLVERRLFPATTAPTAGRLIIEAAALPFVPDASWRRPWQPTPVWMPVYWHRYLTSAQRTLDAGLLLALLDSIAAPLPESERECGWDPAWTTAEGQIELAVRHVRRQARVLAAVCRAGALPPGWQCLLFDPAPGSSVPGSRVDPATFPPVLRQVFEHLAPTRPERLSSKR